MAIVQGNVAPILAPSQIAGSGSPYNQETAQGAITTINAAQTLIQGILDKRIEEQTQINKLKVDNFKLDYNQRLEELSRNFATRVANGEIASTDMEATFRKLAAQDFNEFAKTVPLKLEKLDRMTLESEVYGNIIQKYNTMLGTTLKTANAKQAIQEATAFNDKLVAKASVPDTDVDSLVDFLYNDVSTKPNNVEATKALAQNIKGLYSVNFQVKTKALFEHNDIAGLTNLASQVKQNRFLDKEAKDNFLQDIRFKRKRLLGANEANKYLQQNLSQLGTIDLKKAIADVDKRSDLEVEEKVEIKKQLSQKATKIATQIQQQYGQMRTDAWGQFFKAGDFTDIPIDQWQQLRPEDRQLMVNYKPVSKTDLTAYNQLLYQVMNQDKVDVVKQGINQLTGNDLLALQKLQNSLQDDPVNQKRAVTLNSLVQQRFTHKNIQDKTQQSQLYGVIIDEINQQEQIKKQPLSTTEMLQAINTILAMMDADQPSKENKSHE